MIKYYAALQSAFAARADSDRAATMVEYALMVTLIALACVVALTALGTGLAGKFGDVTTSLG